LLDLSRQANFVYVILIQHYRQQDCCVAIISPRASACADGSFPQKFGQLNMGRCDGSGHADIGRGFDGRLTIKLYSCAVQRQN
jgi:hypothetical protein